MRKFYFFIFAFLAVSLLFGENLEAKIKAKKLDANVNRESNEGNTIDPANLNAAARKINEVISPYIDKSKSKKDKIQSHTFNTNLSQLPDWADIPKSPAGLMVHRNIHNNTPTFITGTFRSKKNPEILSKLDPADVAIEYIRNNKELFKLDQPLSELNVVEDFRDMEGRKHIRCQQMHQGIPVWGKEIIVHLDKQNNIYLVNGRYSPTLKNIGPEDFVLLENKAEAIVKNNMLLTYEDLDLTPYESELLNYKGPIIQKVIWVDDKSQKAYPAWFVQVRPNIVDNWRYFIDARSGKILEKYNSSPADGATTATGTDLQGRNRTLNVFLQGGTYYMYDVSRPMYNNSAQDFFKKGIITTEDARNQDLTNQTKTYTVTSSSAVFSDPVSVSAHYNLSQGYDYYKNTHNRNSLDDNGMTIATIIHVTYNGRSFDNAYWNGMFTVFGDGGQSCREWAGALDFVCHELTHGVVQHTVDLEYKFQSGALNEAFADWGGCMVDREDWKLGEDIARTSAFPTGAVRDMADPHNGGTNQNQHYWLPAHMDEYLDLKLDYDNGGVHINVGIINKATYLIGTAIGKDKLEKIYYRVLKNRYLTKQAQFIDMRLACVKAASELYGAQSAEVNAVKSSFDAVGILNGNATEPDPDLNPVQGAEWISFVNAEWIDDTHMENSLFISKPVINDPQQDILLLTTTQVYTGSGCVITTPDNGQFIIFIDADNNIRTILPDGTIETIITTSGEYHSISISPDGRWLAATSIYSEPRIYVIDLLEGTGKAIDLYIPTTSHTDYYEEPLYADAMDWSLDGSMLLYDAANVKLEESGAEIMYWDINILFVEEEVVQRILPPLPEGIHAGNPTFSQTSSHIIAFDVYDEYDLMHYINAANLFDGSLNNVGYFEADGFYNGYPCYSVDDKKLIFHAFINDYEDFYIFTIPLDATKIAVAGEAELYINEAVYPKWFAIGSRPVGVADKDISTDINIYPNPFSEFSVISYQLSVAEHIKIEVFNSLGSKVAVLFDEYQESGRHESRFDASGLPAGMYYYTIRIGERTESGKMMLVR